MKLTKLKYDCVVVGGGTAGTAAAIAAARRGHKVLLVEEANCLGGVSTAGGVNEWYASLDGMGNIFEEIKTQLEVCGAKFGRFFNSEYLKLCWQELACRSGVELLFHAQAYNVFAEKPKVQNIRCTSCSNNFEIEADFFIDATGEGNLSAMAGASFFKGNADGKGLMHLTLTFVLNNTGHNVNQSLPDGISRIETSAELPGLFACFRLPDDRIYCNMTKIIGTDPTDSFALSKAEVLARRQVAQIVDYLQRTKYPTYSLCSTGSKIGIREGRRIICDYTLTEKDILECTIHNCCEDNIAVATCHIDFLDPNNMGGGGRRDLISPFPIPFRCMLVKDFSNLLVAGKCISGDQVALSSYRMIPTCCAMGQAAGTAIALAKEQGKGNIRDIDINLLRQTLDQDGIELDPNKHTAFSGWTPSDGSIRD